MVFFVWVGGFLLFCWLVVFLVLWLAGDGLFVFYLNGDTKLKSQVKLNLFSKGFVLAQ